MMREAFAIGAALGMTWAELLRIDERRYSKVKKSVIVIGLLASVLFCGCGNTIPEMTQTQQNMITEYAVGTVLKYSASYDDKIICKDIETVAGQEESITESKSDDEEATAVEEIDVHENVTQEVILNEEKDVPTVSVNDVSNGMSLSEFLSMDNFEIVFDEVEVCEAYSDAGEDEIAFELKAGVGKSLLVIKYSVTNKAGQEQTFDTLSKNIKAKVAVSGNTKNVLLTMLDNDLLTSDAIMDANETRTFVIVSEIKAETEVENVAVNFDYEGKSYRDTY